MIFKEKNKEKLIKMFNEANGRCHARILTYYNVEQCLKQVERHLGIAKKDMVGVSIVADPNAQDFPNAYKYTPYSIWFCAERKSSGWDVKPYGKRETARRSRCCTIMLTDKAKEAIIKKHEVL